MSNNRSNLNYVRYDENNDAVDPQPGFTTAQSPPVGAGWSTRLYRNYSADYIAYEYNSNAGIGTRTPAVYVRHDEDNNVGVVSGYVRHDENNDPV